MNVIIGKENNALMWTECSSHQGALIKCRILSNLVLIIHMIDDDSWKMRSDLTTKEEPTKKKKYKLSTIFLFEIFRLKVASFAFRKEDFYF